MPAPVKLTNLQVELLQTFAYSLPDEQLTEIRQLLAHYFLNKADAEMDKRGRKTTGMRILSKLGPKVTTGRPTNLSNEGSRQLVSLTQTSF